MLGMAEISVIGNLGKDPTLTTTQKERKLCRFTVAVNRKHGAEERCDWFHITVFDKQGELAAQYLRKGSLVFVSGPFSLRTYTDTNGVAQTSAELIANKVVFLDRKEVQANEPTGPDDTPY
jgi:single-strand DNA-binding protein